jgi:hypothetical protein
VVVPVIVSNGNRLYLLSSFNKENDGSWLVVVLVLVS